jgi:hypothetical protein
LPQLTPHYTRLHDTTVRRHWEAPCKVDIRGSTITFDPNGPVQPTGPDDDTGGAPGQHETNRQTKLSNAGDVCSAHND